MNDARFERASLFYGWKTMQRLWAPWRSDYVGGQRKDACFLCEAANSESPEESLLVHASSSIIVVMNRFPYNAGHLLVAPRQHVAAIGDLSPACMAEMMTVISDCVGVLTRILRPDGFNVGANLGSAAGAGVPDHLHMHVVPRWHGDTNFMATLDDVRVMSSSLQAMYDDISQSFRPNQGHRE
ncbi:MAG: HIT domain-containing protein [Candidatus Kapabacteria bacterium]|jgi:ATP adenylyltransferase|nr:HIT domain-containing protein [Candidatus Kapabacteria bacterium]